MPFISSLRGSFGPQSKLKRNFNSQMAPSGGSISDVGPYRIHTFTTVGNTTFTTPIGLRFEAFVYGAGGAAGSDNWGNSSGWSYGGGGGYTYGVINANSSSSYLIKVGQGGSHATGSNLNEGGGAGGTTWGNGGGGGLSGIFNNNSYSFSNSLLIAGGGGGGGTSRASGQGVNRGGGGGGSTGQNGTSYSGNRHGKGGTQSGTQLPDAGEYSAGGWFAPGQLAGGHPEPHGGGGGGGYYGGSGGSYFEPNDMGGGGGGSSYAAGTVSNASLQQASYQDPFQGTYYSSSYGNGSINKEGAGQQGQVIIRYLV